MRITPRLVLLVAVPLAVALAFAVRALTPATEQAVEANRLTHLVEVASSASELAHALQNERAAATAYVASHEDDTHFARTAEATDRAAERYRQRRGEVSSPPEGTAAALRRIDRSLEQLPSLRAQVRSGNGSLSSLAFGYRITIAELIAYREGLAQAGGVDPATADRIRAAAAVTEAGENLGQQQAAVTRSFAAGGFTRASHQSFDATRTGYTDALADVYALGPSAWRTWLERSLSGPKALAAQRLEDEAARTTPGSRPDFSPARWHKSSADRLSLLHTVERRIDDDLNGTVTSRRTTLIWWAAGELALVVLTLAGVLFIALRLARAMIRRLRDLRNAAHEVAHRRLPEAMKELSTSRAPGGATPEEIARRAGSPLQTTGRDEIGEVGEAFNAVHHEAVRLAAQQAASHEKFAQTLVGVARRGAVLTGVMAGQLDAVQRDELDPERMRTLFALDHLAIRMERNTNSLLVLGGHGQGRVRTANASCTAVVYAAAQQIERYERVTLGHVEPSIGIAARVVDDVAHLLAELLDNATRFSPPETEVGVAAWHLKDRVVVQIVDEGVGIAPHRRGELNERLATPSDDVGAAARSMGLHVVSRLAARHSIGVELRASSGPGTIAEVTLPGSALAELPPPEQPGGHPALARGTGTSGAPGRDATDSTDSTDPAAGAAGADGGGPADGRASSAPAPAARPQRPLPGGRPVPRRPDRARGADPEHEQTADEAPRPADPAPARSQERVAGISPAGLPVRRRRPTPGRLGARPDEGAGTPGAPGSTANAPGAGDAAGARPAKGPRQRRDSRQVSDVLAAYTQGINRSARASGGGRAAPATDHAAGATDDTDDDTQRSTT
ncbi:sensor histidine kinase [Streptomyces cacaoi]|uniref:histidine kinase n=4 Tax=Streptomyces TaxID=1883 RepID=A0A4Y3QRK3_STRCI|nr:sensor histidine kinase [Streptomyces cacaoi]GEB47822.1 hypothetical protein SCA03_03730 [Streptomyces cacaoi]